ncbi:MAG TPA: ABC transporter permease [Bryobacteraceae bacterium]|jgi:predicted permease|nr:ABC transporter permease [Bryobacteraceae bacterium]
MNLSGDLSYAVRQFRHSPVFTLTAVLTLALGIGGTTAIFSLMHDVMLRSLPVADPASLYRIGSGNDCCVEGGPQDNWGLFSYPLFERLRAAAPEFEQVAAFQAGSGRYSVLRAGIDRSARSMRSEFVTGNYFSVFGIRPFAGRFFTAEDDRAAAAPAAVLSYRGWQMDWGADPSAIGSVAVIQGQPFTIIGVAPPGFFGDTLRSDPPDLWLPVQHEPLVNGQQALLRQSISGWLRAIGRLKPGATTDGMPARLTVVLRQWMEHESGYPAAWMGEIRRMLPRQHLEVIPAGNGVEEMREGYSRSLQILLAVCGLVLLIACANVANLLIARGMARRTQTAIRLAIGASRGRLIRQSMVENLLLAIAGGVAGLGVAYGAERVIVALAFHQATYLPFRTTPSLPVLAFAFGLSLATGILFGAGPAWLATRRDPVEALRGAGRGTGDHASLPRRALLVVQASLSVVLVAGSAMLARSLGNLEHQDFGYRSEGLINVSVNQLPATYTEERLDAVYREARERLRRLPGVENASLAMYAPLTDNWGELIFVDGHPPPSFNNNGGASWDRVSAGHFETTGQPVIRGRGIAETDTRRTERIAVVNEAFVRRFFPKEDPLDRYFGIDLPAYARSYRIVGVVRDAKYTDPTRPARPMFFLPLTQGMTFQEDILRMVEFRSHFMGAILLRSHLPTGDLEPLLRRTLAEVDQNLTVVNVRTMKEQIALVFDQQRAVASLAGMFGVVALLLAAVGLYGVTAYAVIQRTGEIGIRMALGADSGRVLRLVLGSAFRMVGIGLVLGIPLAAGAGRLLAAQLYGINGSDPLALTVAACALGVCGFVASIIPALRASAIDPMSALRTE